MESIDPNTEVRESQFLKARGKSHTPPWHKSRCFVYDCDNAQVEIRAKETIKEDKDFQKIQLKPWQRHVALFVLPDAKKEEDRSKLMTGEQTKDDGDRLLFATLDLRGPGLVDKFHMIAGGLKTLYVFNKGRVREISYSGSREPSIHDEETSSAAA
ncbi:MAG: hypothetical protein M1822_005756 [Bathelium mastoideum]|nr:MAG: hypothetical protein M1822_005756 [Bathelium mastoideum]